MDSYGRELDEIAGALRLDDVATSVRGEAAARFVFAVRGSRAIELSRNGQGWWTEFWDGEVVVDRSYSSADAAIQAARTWLTQDA